MPLSRSSSFPWSLFCQSGSSWLKNLPMYSLRLSQASLPEGNQGPNYRSPRSVQVSLAGFSKSRTYTSYRPDKTVSSYRMMSDCDDMCLFLLAPRHDDDYNTTVLNGNNPNMPPMIPNAMPLYLYHF